jgi:glycerol-3-phosphate dehydrogenase (NAD+)
LSTCKDADILVFVVPHTLVAPICKPLKGLIKSNAIGVSLIKVSSKNKKIISSIFILMIQCFLTLQGFGETPGGGIELISDVIRNILGIEVSVLMGANLANEVADEKFCESCIGSKNQESGKILKDLLQTDNFRITVVPDCHSVEICGALKAL